MNFIYWLTELLFECKLLSIWDTFSHTVTKMYVILIAFQHTWTTWNPIYLFIYALFVFKKLGQGPNVPFEGNNRLRLLVKYTESHCTLLPYRPLDNFSILDNQLLRPLSPCYYSTHDHHQHPSVYLLLLPAQKWICLDSAQKKVFWAFALEPENSIDLPQHIYVLHIWIIYQMTNKVRQDVLRVKTAN